MVWEKVALLVLRGLVGTLGVSGGMTSLRIVLGALVGIGIGVDAVISFTDDEENSFWRCSFQRWNILPVGLGISFLAHVVRGSKYGKEPTQSAQLRRRGKRKEGK